MSDIDNKTVITAVNRVVDNPVSEDACLVVIYGMALGKKFQLNKNILIIGRSAAADIQVEQDAVSRNHCRLTNDGQSIRVDDLDSTNGTYVNDRLVKQHTLRDGDFLKVGRSIFKFLSGDNIEAAYHEEIYRLTTMDGLTQVYNKRYFIETLERELGRAQRYQRELSLLMFDIDHFKKINDTFGHLAGDAILRDLAATVKEHTRHEDMLSRYGGEEFAIVLPEIDRKHAMIFGEKICSLVSSTTFKFEGTVIPLTISIGISTMPTDLKLRDSSEFIKMADENLYRAKEQGRNRVVG